MVFSVLVPAIQSSTRQTETLDDPGEKESGDAEIQPLLEERRTPRNIPIQSIGQKGDWLDMKA